MTLGSQAWFSAAASQSKGAENEEVKIKAQEAQLALVQKLKAKGLLQDRKLGWMGSRTLEHLKVC